MALFGGSTTQVGIDIGTNSIKVVEVRSTGRNRGALINYGIIDFQQTENVSVRNWAPERIAEMIKKIVTKAGIRAKKAGIAVGVEESFTAYLRLPMIEQKDLNKAISYEVKKFIPMDLADVKLGSEVVRRDTRNQQIHVLVVVVPNTIIAKYRQVAQQAGLELITLEVETFSLIRTLLQKVNGVTLLIDIGALKTSLSIIKEDHTMLNSSIDFGGTHFTRAVSQGLNVSADRAEAMKVKEGMSGQAQNVMKSQADRLLTAVKNTVQTFESQHGEKVNQILVLGNTSQMAGFNYYITKALGGIQVLQINPFKNIKSPSKLPKNILPGLGVRLAVAMGVGIKLED